MKLLLASCVCLLLPLASLSAAENKDVVSETDGFSDHEADKRSAYGFGLGKRAANKYSFGLGKRQSLEGQVTKVQVCHLNFPFQVLDGTALMDTRPRR